MVMPTGRLVSRVGYPIVVTYDGQQTMLPSKGKLEGIDGGKVTKMDNKVIADINADLPNGVIYIP